MNIPIALSLKRLGGLFIEEEMTRARIDDHRRHLFARRRTGDQACNRARPQGADQDGDLIGGI